MENVEFYRGTANTYINNKQKYIDGVYFATDTHDLFMNDVNYGVGSFEIKRVVKDIDVKNDGTLVVTFVDDSRYEDKEFDLKSVMQLVYEDRFVSLENRVATLELEVSNIEENLN